MDLDFVGTDGVPIRNGPDNVRKPSIPDHLYLLMGELDEGEVAFAGAIANSQ